MSLKQIIVLQYKQKNREKQQLKKKLLWLLHSLREMPGLDLPVDEFKFTRAQSSDAAYDGTIIFLTLLLISLYR
tara:strand:+ start:183 stop:404 length:222 start_codon:yes stop_codon:yes gene_type:complete